MKKILALLLALVMTLSLTACGSKDDASSDVAVSGDNVSSENADNETDSESETESASKTETESETESKKETGKNETTKPQNSSSTGNSGSSKPATGTQKPTGNTSSNTQKPSSSTSKPNTSKPSSSTSKPSSSTSNDASKNYGLKEIKFVSKNLANPYITKNGQDLLTRLYGNNHTIQAGDSVTWDIVLTSGSMDDWYVGCNGGKAKVNGNRVTATATGEWEVMRLCLTPKKNTQKTFYSNEKYDVVTDYNGKITDNSAEIGYQLEEYAKRKGMKRVSGVDIWGYVWNPTLKKSDVNLSLTHNIDSGCDYIRIVDNPDWVDEVIWLIDEYEKMGVITFFFVVNSKGGFSATADTAESAKNLKK